MYVIRIEGNLFVRSGATVYANGVRIDGNIQADRAVRVQVRDNSSIGGDIQVIRSGLLIVTSANIGGNLQAFDNSNDQLYFGNTIGGDLQAFDNYGTVSIWDNLIDGNLQCKDNVPPPTGGNNLVQGNMEDQCENLLPDEFATGRVLPSEWQFHLFLPAFVK